MSFEGQRKKPYRDHKTANKSSRDYSRRDFLALMGSATTGTLFWNPSGQAREAKSDRPNILWILAEDICPDLACYGTPLVQTPNLDRCASAGLRFTNAFTTAPVCSASRSAMITGMYQTTIGAHQHRSQRDNHRHGGDDTYIQSYMLPEPIEAITEYFRRSGYFTANVKTAAPGVSASGKTDFNFSLHGAPFDGDDWNQRQPGQPFFAQLSINVTHRGPHWQRLDEELEDRIDPEKVILPPYVPDHPITRQDWAAYLDAIQLMDSYVGRILQRLDEEGLTDKTVVIFIGDNGRCQVRGKQWLYDAGIRIPLIVRWPGKLTPGVRDDLVSAIDISAAVLKIAGIEPPAHLQGQDFLSPTGRQREYVFAARDRCDETIETIRCVRTKKYKYIRNFMPFLPYMQSNQYKDTNYPARPLLRQLHQEGGLTMVQQQFMAPQKPVEELYDLEKDPYEILNLANSPEHLEALVHLRTVLHDWMIRTNDLGLIPEPELEDMGVKYDSKYMILQHKNNKNLIPDLLRLMAPGNQKVVDTERIKALMKDDRAPVRFWAIMNLHNAGPEARCAIGVLIKSLEDQSASVRLAAAWTLWHLDNDPAALPVLLRELHHKNHAVRHYTALVLEQMADKAKKALQNEPYDNVNRVVNRIFSR